MDSGDVRNLNFAARLDQAIEAMREVATLVKAYHAELLKQGFSRHEALTLTGHYQDSLLRPRPIDRGGA